jgi:hypothetical protein
MIAIRKLEESERLHRSCRLRLPRAASKRCETISRRSKISYFQ